MLLADDVSNNRSIDEKMKGFLVNSASPIQRWLFDEKIYPILDDILHRPDNKITSRTIFVPISLSLLSFLFFLPRRTTLRLFRQQEAAYFSEKLLPSFSRD